MHNYLYQYMNNQQEEVILQDKKDKLEKKRQKAKDRTETSQEAKVITKKEIRKEKNRLAAQKSRDKRQQYLEQIEKQNQQLKDIVSHCEQCSQTYRQLNQNQQSIQEEPSLFQERQEEEQIPLSGTPPTWSIENPMLRHEEDSSSSVSKFLWFCVFTTVICVAIMGGDVKEPMTPVRLALETNTSANLTTDEPVNLRNSKTFYGSKTRNHLMNSPSSKQCRRCMECFGNMTSSNSLAPLNNANIANSTDRNSTNSTLLRNTTNKVLFCKSKALFFKKVYNALFKSEKGKGRSSQVGRVQTTGKSLAQFMDKDCFIDSQIDENQLYNVEFTVAIMELIPVKEPKNLTHHHFSVNQ